MLFDIFGVLLFLVFLLLGPLPIGLVILHLCRIRLPSLAQPAVAIIWGIVIVAVTTYLLIRLNLGISVPWIYCIGPFGGLWYLWRYHRHTKLPPVDRLLCLSIILSSVIPFLLNVTTRMTGHGYAFYGTHGGDTLFHLAIIQRLGLSYPFENPFLSGTPLPNYHFLSDLFIAIPFHTFYLPLIWIYVWVYPALLLIICSTLVFWVLYRLTDNRNLSAIGTIAVTVGSNLYYLAPLISAHAARNPSVFWIDEYATRLVNPQLLMSYCIVLSIFLVWQVTEKPTYRLIGILGLISGILFLFKSFAFILLCCAIGLIVLTDLRRKQLLSTLWLVLTVGVGGLLALSSLKPGPSYFLLEPLWFIKTMYEAPDRLNDVSWELKRQEYLVHNNYLRIAQLYVTGLIVFLVGNLGFRLIGLAALFQKQTRGNRQVIFAITGMSVAGMALPLLFIQSGAAWNTLQYFFYAIFFLGILSVVVIHKVTTNKPKLGLILVGLLIIIGLPGVVADTRSYWSSNNRIIVNSDIIEATKFLQLEPPGVMIIDPQLGELPILTAFSGQASYYVYPLALEALESQDTARRQLTEQTFTASPPANLASRGIRYVVGYNKNIPPSFTNLLYRNQTISIFELP